MLLERIEVAVGVEDFQIVDDAPRGDQAVDRLADRYAPCAQREVVPRRGEGDRAARHADEGRPPSRPPAFEEFNSESCPSLLPNCSSQD